MKTLVTFELETGETDLADILDGVTMIIARNFPSGQFYGGVAEVDEGTIAVEEISNDG